VALLLPRHGRACPGHLDSEKRCALPIGITGTRPVMTKEKHYFLHTIPDLRCASSGTTLLK